MVSASFGLVSVDSAYTRAAMTLRAEGGVLTRRVLRLSIALVVGAEAGTFFEQLMTAQEKDEGQSDTRNPVELIERICFS